MKNILSNNKSRFLSVLVILAAILLPIAVHARDSYLFASVNGNTQNFGGAVFQYTPPGAQTTFAPGLSRPRGLAIYRGDLYVATNTLDPVTGNLQPGILKVSASGVQTPFATLSTVNFSAEGRMASPDNKSRRSGLTGAALFFVIGLIVLFRAHYADGHHTIIPG